MGSLLHRLRGPSATATDPLGSTPYLTNQEYSISVPQIPVYPSSHPVKFKLIQVNSVTANHPNYVQQKHQKLDGQQQERQQIQHRSNALNAVASIMGGFYYG